MKISKNKVFKFLFIVSFLPYLIILILSLYAAFFGFTFFFSTGYGWEAFYASAVVLLFYLTAIISVIPICLIYDVFYIIRNIVIKRKNK